MHVSSANISQCNYDENSNPKILSKGFEVMICSISLKFKVTDV